jgi:hypothetical protein
MAGSAKRSPRKKINLKFRPESYWIWPSYISPSIKGNARRAALAEAAAVGKLEGVPASFFADSLSSEDLANGNGPGYITGEYLPNLRPGEVEIARVTVNSMFDDAPGMSGSAMEVSSIRARPKAGGIAYRIATESGVMANRYTASPDWSEQPLTLEELVDLMADEDLVEQWWDDAYEALREAWYEMREIRPSRLRATGSTVVYSEYYPELAEAWAVRGRKWVRRR